jgi:nucleolar protein 14
MMYIYIYNNSSSHYQNSHIKSIDTTFEDMDTQFKELAELLNFRDKEQDRQDHMDAKKAGTLSKEDKEMDDWNKEMKEYLFDRKVKATDRTKTAEEIAKEESERLHELETKRLARMNGDFENDDLSDVSDDEDDTVKKYKKKKAKVTKKTRHNDDELDSDEEESDELETRFTADGLVYVDKEGNFVKKVEKDDDNDGDFDQNKDESSVVEDAESLGESDDDASVESDNGLSDGEEELELGTEVKIGTKIKGKYQAEQQFEGKGKWYKGEITKSYADEAGNTLYDVLYDDGDTEEGMKPENIRRQNLESDDEKKLEEKRIRIAKMQEKRYKAKQKAR